MFLTFKIQQKYIDKGFKLRNELIIELILNTLFFWSNRDDVNEASELIRAWENAKHFWFLVGLRN